MIERFDLQFYGGRIHLIHDRSTPHKIGSSGLSPDAKYCYVPIPKNSSTTMKSLIAGWTHVNFNNAPDASKFLVVLRDPIRRFASAVAEFLAGKNGLHNDGKVDVDYYQLLSIPIIKKWIFETCYLDAHCLPQAYYLQGLPLEKTLFFNQDQSGISKIVKLLGLTVNEPVLNAVESTDKIFVKNWVLDQIQNCPELEKTINVHYWCDHQLLDSVEIL